MEIKPSITCKFSDFLLAMCEESDVKKAAKLAAYDEWFLISGTSDDFATEEELIKNCDKLAVLQLRDLGWNEIVEVTIKIEDREYICDLTGIVETLKDLFAIKL